MNDSVGGSLELSSVDVSLHLVDGNVPLASVGTILRKVAALTPPPQIVEDEKRCFYRDPQGVVQGPFPTEEVRQWSQAGYFQPDLPPFSLEPLRVNLQPKPKPLLSLRLSGMKIIQISQVGDSLIGSGLAGNEIFRCLLSELPTPANAQVLQLRFAEILGVNFNQVIIHEGEGPCALGALVYDLNRIILNVVPLPSIGSALHGEGMCMPCAWFWKQQGCANSVNCRYCHLCPQGELKARKQSKKKTAKAALAEEYQKRIGAMASDTDA